MPSAPISRVESVSTTEYHHGRVAVGKCLPARKRRNARRVTALLDWNGTLNARCVWVCTALELRFDAMSVRGQGVARAFDERLLLFSRQQTFGPSVATTHQRRIARGDDEEAEAAILRAHAQEGAHLVAVSRSVVP